MQQGNLPRPDFRTARESTSAASRFTCAVASEVPDHVLLRPIGQGAYGDVWLARSVLGQLRAVKVVYRRTFENDRPYHREFEGIRRFEPISRSHPSQVAILHVGRNVEADYFYYVMELADNATGRDEPSPEAVNAARIQPFPPALPEPGSPPPYTPHTLRHDLETHSRLPVSRCIEIGLALTTALDHLHRHQLVHRDVKPSNILFIGGVAKLGDIGLVSSAGDARSIVGTEGYLPPEGPGTPQADLFSLGMVLYEAATGMDRRRFPELPANLRELPDWRTLIELNEILLKAGARDRNCRYQTAGEMRRDLERLAAGRSLRARRRTRSLVRAMIPSVLLAATLFLAILTHERSNRSPSPLAGDGPPLAFVMPLRDLETNEPARANALPIDGVLRSRLTDGLIDSLEAAGLRVGPRRSGWVFEEEATLLSTEVPKLGFHHVITGRAGTVSNLLQVNLALLILPEREPRWTTQITRTTNELLSLQTEMTARLAAALGLTLDTNRQQAIDLSHSNNQQALQWYRIGFSNYSQSTMRALSEAKVAFGEALKLDPMFLEARAAIAQVNRNLTQDRSNREMWTEVQTSMREILQIDPTFFPARYWLLSAQLLYEWDWDGAKIEFGRLRRLKPDDHLTWAIHWRVLGRPEEARIEQQLFEANPRTDIDGRVHLMTAPYIERRYDEGILVARETIDMHPRSTLGYLMLVYNLIGKGDSVLALAELERARGIEDSQELRHLVACASALQGDRAAAEEVLKTLEDEWRGGRSIQPYFVARVHAALGRKDQALRWLARAYEDRAENLVNPDYCGGLHHDPAWDEMREEPGFQDLVRRIWPKGWPP